jgi:hypothetical protein
VAVRRSVHRRGDLGRKGWDCGGETEGELLLTEPLLLLLVARNFEI